MDIREVFAHNLKTARLSKGWSQEELAHRAGIDRTYVSALERSVYAATIDMVQQLAVALGQQSWQMMRPRENDAEGD
ncbi:MULTISPECIES: helix-turn-helix transcriptional regulator [unclassified Rhizobium]|uniref:helix-turn-helix domain-containing protein n=1 Tax=unclassified Rhizobium TaxID=2613769 RepID=UPI0006FE9A8D|nr:MULTISPECIES: helix-turn-helix transcriptional regulator [unclassified Rhizobium]KQV39922.1 XRE family transcriptional regulator [Rhizobium sp. Root1212]KRD31632.1 XRE family transcriptional regulator [Rhizobium sp. Root268]